MSLGTLALVAAVTLVAELPDKTMFATLVLSTRFRPALVWVGVAAGFAVHVVIAVTAGGVLGLLPHRAVEAVVAAIFVLGAVLLLREGGDDEEEDEELRERLAAARAGAGARTVLATSFGLIFVGEWGDITQITTANYAARYHDPVSVGIGAVIGLWTAALLAVTLGRRVLERLPVEWFRRVVAGVLLVFAVIAAVAAIRG